MSNYPIVVMVLGFVAGFVGLENLLLLYLTRRRAHLWVGALGLASAGYAYACRGLYSARDVVEGGGWQLWQFVFAGIMVAAAVLIGLEYLGRITRRAMLAIGAFLVVLEVLLFVPGFGVSDRPAPKRIDWLGITYHEMDLGLAPILLIAVGFVWMGYVAVLLIRRARHGDRRDRVMAVVQVLWFLAGINDLLVTSGVYPFIYLAEYTFILIVLVVGVLLVEAQHRRGISAEFHRRELALEVLAKDRDLALSQAELTEAAKLAAVGRLAAGVAHEVNNPLAYVMGNLQILKQELRHDDELGQLAVEALDGAIRIQRVVRQLSNFTSRGGDSSNPGSVAEAIESASKMASAELKDRARVQLEIEPELPPVSLDEGKLAQVLLNLLINAAQSIPAGDRDRNLVRVRARRIEDGSVEIAVEDSGAGIAQEALTHLFEPFFTTKQPGQGVGLGLAISRELVSRAGGRIGAENLEHGARFAIVLPPSPSAERARRPSGGLPAPSEPGTLLPRLLLVDDEAEVLVSLHRVLSRRFRVDTAASGREAIKRIDEAEGSYHAIVCDLMMPDGSGLDVLSALKQSWPSLVPRMVLITGGALGQERLKLDGCAREVKVLEKPFRIDELVNLIES